MMTRAAFFRDYIATWEGGLSLDPDDDGNWFAAKGCAPVLIGSNLGVTGAALAAFRGCDTVSARDMKALTLDEAARLGERLYYDAPGFGRLPWDPAIASVVDFGWGAGPREAIVLLQRMLGLGEDGVIGEATAAGYRAAVAARDIVHVAGQWRAARESFYRQLCAHRPGETKYLRGWLRRSAYFAPASPWWRRFTAVAA